MQKETAIAVGLSRRSYSRIETGTREATARELQLLGEHFGLDGNYMLWGVAASDELPTKLIIKWSGLPSILQASSYNYIEGLAQLDVELRPDENTLTGKS